MAGFDVSRSILDGRSGTLVNVLRDTFDGVVRVKAFLDAHTDAELKALPLASGQLAYSDADITVLRNSFGDLANLVSTAYGQRTQAVASNFTFNAFKLLGLN